MFQGHKETKVKAKTEKKKEQMTVPVLMKPTVGGSKHTNRELFCNVVRGDMLRTRIPNIWG